MVKISVIIVSHNTGQLTIDCVKSIFAHQHATALEVIVVDNASRDDSLVRWQEEFGARIKVIKSATDKGLAAGNNLGAREAVGTYLFFLNSDTFLKRDVFTPLLAALDADSTLGIVAPQLLTRQGQSQAYSHGEFPRLSHLFFGRLIAPISVQEKAVTPEAHGLLAVDWVSGAALVIRREVLIAVQGWDEKFFQYFEDVDLCWRVKNEGYGVAVLNTVSLVHFGGRSLAISPTRRKRYYKSQEYFFQKNYGRRQAFILKIIRWPYQTWVWLND